MLAYAASRSGGLAALVEVVGALGGAVLLVVLVRASEDLLAWALAPLGVAYAIALVVDGHAVDEAAPLVAAGLLLCGELAVWSLDARWRIEAEPAVLRRRALALGLLVFAGLAAAALVVAVAAAPAGRGLAWTTLGAAAAVCAIGAAVAVSKKRPASPPR